MQIFVIATFSCQAILGIPIAYSARGGFDAFCKIVGVFAFCN